VFVPSAENTDGITFKALSLDVERCHGESRARGVSVDFAKVGVPGVEGVGVEGVVGVAVFNDVPLCMNFRFSVPVDMLDMMPVISFSSNRRCQCLFNHFSTFYSEIEFDL
jgi:hypothetical protein